MAGIDQLSLLKRIVKAQYTFPDELAALSSGSGSGLDDALMLSIASHIGKDVKVVTRLWLLSYRESNASRYWSCACHKWVAMPLS